MTASIEDAPVPLVAILEDEQHVAEQMSLWLEGEFISRVITDYQQIETVCASEEFDAISIDWEWRGAMRGIQILRALQRFCPDAARIVFTKHHFYVGTAQQSGADYVLMKRPDGDLAEFTEVMRNAVRLGLARKVARRLKELQVAANLPVLVGPLDKGSEDAIRDRALAEVWKGNGGAQVDDQLFSLLRRRGWWRQSDFSLQNYLGMSWWKKLEWLCESVDATSEELAVILEISDASDIGLLVTKGDSDLVEACSLLLSVLGFTLRLANYESMQMRHFWRGTQLFQGCSQAPPWDEAGMLGYLQGTGRRGLRESVYWIRGH